MTKEAYWSVAARGCAVQGCDTWSHTLLSEHLFGLIEYRQDTTDTPLKIVEESCTIVILPQPNNV